MSLWVQMSGAGYYLTSQYGKQCTGITSPFVALAAIWDRGQRVTVALSDATDLAQVIKLCPIGGPWAVLGRWLSVLRRIVTSGMENNIERRPRKNQQTATTNTTAAQVSARRGSPAASRAPRSSTCAAQPLQLSLSSHAFISMSVLTLLGLVRLY